MEGGGGGAAAPYRSLQETPTWALAIVCFIFISLSLVIEHLIHLLSQWLRKHRKNALFEAVEKLKSVLMVLGFMSLTLTVTQKSIVKICIPNKVATTMLPCRHSSSTKTSKSIQERFLAAAESSGGSSSGYCSAKGMTSLISESGINQLNIFIFALAVMQIVYSVVTMALGRAKGGFYIHRDFRSDFGTALLGGLQIAVQNAWTSVVADLQGMWTVDGQIIMRRWEAWEKETQTVEYQAANDPERFRITRQTTFGRRHMNSFTANSLLLWTKCFFRQFFHSVAKVDYLTLRHGFIAAHLSNNNSFNFQKYIQRSLEDDFKDVVGISPLMWIVVVIFMLLDVHGWHVYLWVSFLPLTIVLVLGTKLEVVVAEMALQLKDQHSVIRGAPLVQPNDNLFWFHHPRFVLTLLHYTLFMNAFELAFFIWVTLQFGIRSCYHEKIEIIIIRVVLAVTVQVMCSYITLPLYALVTQMGSQYKGSLVEDQVASVIKKWHAGVKQKRKKNDLSVSKGSSFIPSSPMSTSNRTMDSPDYYSHHHHHHRRRDHDHTVGSPDFSSHSSAPTFAEMSPVPTQNEIIVEDVQETEQEFAQSSNVVKIDIHEATKSKSSI